MINKPLTTLLISCSLSILGCTSTENNANPSQGVDDAQIATWLDKQILAPEGLSIAEDNIKYLTGHADLNSDGHLEHFVLIQDPYFCGSGGCSSVIFDHSGQIITQMTVSDTPVLLADSEHNGWQDFIVWSSGAYHLMSFNGNSYPTNPSVETVVDLEAQRQSAKQQLMATELYQQDGYDIKAVYDGEIWAPAQVFEFTFKHYGDADFTYHAAVNAATGNIDITTQPNK